MKKAVLAGGAVALLLLAGAWLALEHGYDQAVQCRQLLEEAGYTQVFSQRDLAGIERISGGCLDASRSSI